MTYGEVYLEGWKSIFNYEGVFNRPEFWLFMIDSGVTCLLPLLCWQLAVTINNDYGVSIFSAPPMSFTLMLISAVPAVALVVRRTHGIGYSGWWITVAALVPATGIILLILCRLPSGSRDQV